MPEIQLGLLPAFAVVRLHEIVPHERLMDEALEFAGRIAAKPRLAVAMAKSFYNRGLGGDEMRYAADAFPLLFMHEDAREGVAAFREKRKPKFKD